MSRRRRWLAVFVLAALAAVPLLASVEVKLKLPVRAKLDLAGRRTVAALPFLVVGREGGEGAPPATSRSARSSTAT